MKTAEVSITTTPREFPAGTTFAGFRFRILLIDDPTRAAEQTVSVTTVQFSGLAAGRYRVEVSAVNDAGGNLQDPAFVILDVPADTGTVTIDVPATVIARIL